MGRIYDTKRWLRLRAAKLARDPVCQYCRRAAAGEVDHVIPIEQGGDVWSWENLKSSCKRCHSRKMRHVDMLGRDHVPVKGCDKNGLPLDPAHPWNSERTGG